MMTPPELCGNPKYTSSLSNTQEGDYRDGECSFIHTKFNNVAVQGAKQVEGANVVVIDPPAELQEELYAVHSDNPRAGDRLAEIGRLPAPSIAVMNTHHGGWVNEIGQERSTPARF
jgi:hypothetical protein